jgi:predicted metalloprotease with PDZ domain
MIPVRARLGWWFLLTMACCSDVWAQDTVQHDISFPELRLQYVHVLSRFPADGEYTDLLMPSWTPGSYLMREFAGKLDRISFHDSLGRPLAFAKNGKNRWRVESTGVDTVIAEYDMHAGELGVQTSWVSEKFILINGASVFLYTDASRDLSHELSIEEPAALNVHTSLLAAGAKGRYRAIDYDQLVDSPVVIADAPSYQFTSAGSSHTLLNIGETQLWDGDVSAKDVKAVTDATQEFWGVNPFSREYWFFNFLVEHSGGLEHDQSTVMMTSRWQMRNREDYLKWLSLVAHEYFHAWNVRRLRPEELLRYDYGNEQYSSQLWLAEGLTSYYDNLLLSRARIASPEEFLKMLAKELHKFEIAPGRRLQTAEEASRDTWVRHYRPVPNSINSTMSYYTRGAVIGLVVDARLRRETKGRYSLDHVLREMYRRYDGKGYAEGAFETIVTEMGGKEFAPWLSGLLRGTSDPDLDDALDWFGLELQRDPDRSANEEAGEPIRTGFGVTWDKKTTGLVIASVLHGGSGARSGLLPGDELLAIGGERVTKDKLTDRLLRLRPDETVNLLLVRRERIIELPVSVEAGIPERYLITSRENLKGRHVKRMESWLGQNLTIKH